MIAGVCGTFKNPKGGNLQNTRFANEPLHFLNINRYVRIGKIGKNI